MKLSSLLNYIDLLDLSLKNIKNNTYFHENVQVRVMFLRKNIQVSVNIILVQQI